VVGWGWIGSRAQGGTNSKVPSGTVGILTWAKAGGAGFNQF